MFCNFIPLPNIKQAPGDVVIVACVPVERSTTYLFPKSKTSVSWYVPPCSRSKAMASFCSGSVVSAKKALRSVPLGMVPNAGVNVLNAFKTSSPPVLFFSVLPSTCNVNS